MSFLLDNKKIELNNMTDKNNIVCNIEMDLTKLSKTELLVKCEENGIKKCKSKNKEELIEIINTHTQIPKKQIEFIIEDDGLETLQLRSTGIWPNGQFGEKQVMTMSLTRVGP